MQNWFWPDLPLKILRTNSKKGGIQPWQNLSGQHTKPGNILTKKEISNNS
jgi:hypothetical protein